MGVFSVQVKLKNWQNRFLSDDKKGADVTCNALVDSGAAELALPSEIISRLKLEELDKVRVYTADGGEHEYRIFGIVLKSGCQWRMLPGDFPSRQVVYKYFRQWNQKTADEERSLLEQALKNVVDESVSAVVGTRRQPS